MPTETGSSSRLALHITAAAERALRFGHPWLYAQAIRKQNRAGRSGDLAAIYDRRNRFLALGLYDASSPLRVRVLQRHRPAAIDRAWFRQRLADALAVRRPLLADRRTTGYRIVHGENDGLPGLVLDRYASTLVLKLYTPAWYSHLEEFLAAQAEAVPAARVVLRLSRAIQGVRGQLNGFQDGAVLSGPAVKGPVFFMERGVHFEADVVHGQKTGFFLDQRENRARTESLSRDRRALDVFAAAGAFSVCAARGGAREVISVDASRPALEAARRNMAHNRTDARVRRAVHHVIVGDGFQVLQQLGARRERFDLVVLDPPAFAKRREEVPSALAAYGQLTRLALRVLAPAGTLFISCCSGQVDADAFCAAVHRAARACRRPLRELARTGQPADHPVTFPEGAYLKGLFATPHERTARA